MAEKQILQDFIDEIRGDPRLTNLSDPGSVHDLKVHPIPFLELVAGLKNFEYRKNDRDYKVGDKLVLREYTGTAYTGRYAVRGVSYVLFGPEYGVPEGFCIMSLTGAGYKA